MLDILAVILHVALNRAWTHEVGRVSLSGEECLLPKGKVGYWVEHNLYHWGGVMEFSFHMA